MWAFSQLGKSSITELLHGSQITIDEVDSILRDGGNDDNSTLRIAAHFAKGLDDNADFLNREYLTGRYGCDYRESGKGFSFGNHNLCAWFTTRGIEFDTGVTAKNGTNKVLVPWETAAARIDELMRNGQYVLRPAYDNALDNERRELAAKLWNFYRFYGVYMSSKSE